MKIGLTGIFGATPKRDFAYAKDFAQTMEAIGFHSLWLPEHVVFFPRDKLASAYPYDADGRPPWDSDDFGIYDPLFVIAAAAQVTTTLRFATSVLILPQRPPLLTAKEIVTLDHLTGGRFEFGVGAGWMREEYEALGVAWKQRGKRFDEAIEAIRAAWTQDVARFEGDFVAYEDVILRPRPLRPGGPPFLIGGDSPAAMRRAARLGDGWYGWWSGYALEPHVETLHAALRAEGRSIEDPDFHLKLGLPIDFTPDRLQEKIEEAERLGVEELVLAAPIGTKRLRHDLEVWAQAAGIV